MSGLSITEDALHNRELTSLATLGLSLNINLSKISREELNRAAVKLILSLSLICLIRKIRNDQSANDSGCV